MRDCVLVPGVKKSVHVSNPGIKKFSHVRFMIGFQAGGYGFGGDTFDAGDDDFKGFGATPSKHSKGDRKVRSVAR